MVFWVNFQSETPPGEEEKEKGEKKERGNETHSSDQLRRI